jgi:hypothetical protein
MESCLLLKAQKGVNWRLFTCERNETMHFYGITKNLIPFAIRIFWKKFGISYPTP